MVLDATYRSFNVDDVSTYFQKFAEDSVVKLKPANFAGSSDPYCCQVFVELAAGCMALVK